MAVYNPLFVYLTPASIPQVVAHIQQYLADNPIISDPEAIAEAIQEYIEEHPEIISVASVNGKKGNVVLTGSDININASSAVSVETQLLNLASMIQSASGDITQIESQLETIYTNIGTIETNVSNNTNAISALQTSVEGQGMRLAGAETDIEALESAQSAQNTRLNTAEGNISSLQTRMTQAENDIETNENNIDTLNTSLQNTNTTIDEIKPNIIFDSENGATSGTLLQNVTLYKKIKVYWGTQDKGYLLTNEALNNNASQFAMPVSYFIQGSETSNLFANCARINFNGTGFTTDRNYTITIQRSASSDNTIAVWSGFRVFRIEGVLE